MASGIGLSLDTSFLQSLENADKKIKDLTNKTNHLSRVTVQAFQQMANGGVAPYIEQLNRQKKALEEIGKIKGTSPFLTKMQTDAKVAIDEINNLIKALERTKAYRGEMSGRTAISFANSVLGQRGEAKSIDNMKLAISQLEAAQNRLNLNTKTGQKHYEKIGETIKKVKDELDKATGANKKLTQESEKTKSTVKGLGGAISAAFAVNAIRGFLNNLIKVRGEFELQHRSLQVLLQDVDEANELWDKTIALAVKSPYRVKELVTYTKQLAAYRVESEKLYDTTRMLADVSAGLGVDMNRLILAFGQVKAANFLRGTELRQFSEAGVNMLEELAKRFTMLEGRAVSVGDVFERVSKRMVKFADVEAVFQTITSEGGVFYQMQEKQSETLRGMIMNLKDSVDLMFNEMGKASDSPLKGAIRLVRELVENWRKFIPLVSAAGSAFLAAFSVKVIASIGAAFSALWGIISANPIGAAITLITALVAGIVSAKNKVNELTAAMNEVDRDVTKQLEDSIALYRKLAEQVRDVTSTEKERNEAMEQLKSRFGDILPDQLLELEYIQTIADNYDEATNAMMNYYNSKATEQKRDRIESQFGEDIDTQVVDLIGGTRKMIETWSEKGLINEREQVALLSGVGGIVRGVSEGIKNGEVDNDFDSVRKAILKKLSEYAGVDSTWEKYVSGGGSMLFEKNISEMIRQITNYRAAIEGIEGLPTETYAEKEAKNIFLREKENIEATKNAFKEITNLVSEYSNLALDKWGDLDKRFNALITKLPQEMVEYIPLLSEMFEKMKVAAAGGAFEFGKSIQGFQQEFTRALPQIMWSQTSEGMFSPISEEINNELISLVDNMDETLQKEADKLDLSKFQKSVVSAMEVIAKETGVNVDKFAKFIPKISDSLSTTRTSVKQQIDLLKMDVTTWTESLEVDQENLNVLRPEALDLTQKQIDETNILIKAYEMLWKFLGGDDKGNKKTNNTIEERIKVVDQMNKKYLELNKTLSKGESLKGAFAAYKDAFATAYGREDVRRMSAEDFAKNVLNFPDEDAVIAWLDNLAETVKDKEDKFKVQMARGKFEMDVQVRLKKKDDQQLLDDIQELFDQYDLSLELKKLNIPPDLAKSLFDVDYLDLDGLKKAVQEQEAKFIGTDMEEEYKKFLDKISDLQRKQREDEAKEFINFLKKNLNEIQIIQDKGAYNISLADRLFGEGKITAEQYMSSIRQIVEDTNKEVAKVNLDKFKDSTTYIKAMGNLAAYSRDELEGMINALQGQVGANAGNMGADEIRAYYEALERLIDQYDKLESPFQKGEINDLIEYLGLQKQLNQEKEKEAALEQRKFVLKARLEGLQVKLASQQASGDAEGAKFTQGLIKSTVNELKEVDGKLVSVTSNISVISEKVANLGDGMVKALVVAQKVVNEIANVANAATKMFDDIKSAADALGADTESGGWAKAGYAMEMVGGVSSELTSGLANLASGNFAGALANGVGMVTKLISGFAKIHDQDYQDIIEAQAEEVERLGKAYEKLEAATESAYSIHHLQQYNEELERNVELQIASYKAMIAAEQAKKNTDDEQIAAWNEEIEALTQQWEELKQSLVEGVGGVSDYRSQTREFVDSWVSAFKETGDGLSGLKENFREFFDNIIAEQAALRVTEKFLAPFYDSLNSALYDLSLSVEESKDLREEADRIMPELSKALELIWNALGGSRGESGGAGLSALQKGISGMSEQQAEILTAYWNSVRGYTASMDSKMNLILANLNVSAEDNPMLAQLMMVARNTSAINTLLSSLVKSGHTLGGSGIKVFMS